MEPATVSPYLKKSSREAYGLTLTEMAQTDERIVVVTADVPDSLRLGQFRQLWPERVFNFGLAEQNMMSAASGLAREGKLPYVSVYSMFGSLRSAEQARTDVAYGNLPVRICVSHSGISLGQAGPSHHTLEDVALYRSFANMTVIVPADPVEAAMVLRATKDLPGPVFIRMSRAPEPTVYLEEEPFIVGKGRWLRQGTHATLMAYGASVGYSLQAAEMLAAEGIQAGVVDMATVKPIDQEAILRAAKTSGAILTIEEHNIIGGLGSAVAETLAEAGTAVRFRRLGIPDVYTLAAPYEELQAYYRLDPAGIAQTVRELLRA